MPHGMPHDYLAEANRSMHGAGRDSVRGQMTSLILSQRRPPSQGGFSPFNEPAGMAILERRNPGRRGSSYEDMRSFSRQTGSTLLSPGVSFAYPGKGLAHVPDDAATTAPYGVASLGRPGLLNHEFEHAYSQTPQHQNREIAPVLGDLAFGAMNYRLQEGKPLRGQIKFPSGYKQDIGYMSERAREHGYYQGRSMTDLLNTKEGKSYQRLISRPQVDPQIKQQFIRDSRR